MLVLTQWESKMITLELGLCRTSFTIKTITFYSTLAAHYYLPRELRVLGKLIRQAEFHCGLETKT